MIEENKYKNHYRTLGEAAECLPSRIQNFVQLSILGNKLTINKLFP